MRSCSALGVGARAGSTCLPVQEEAAQSVAFFAVRDVGQVVFPVANSLEDEEMHYSATLMRSNGKEKQIVVVVVVVVVGGGGPLTVFSSPVTQTPDSLFERIFNA
ncbi:hypothetical protein F2P81_018329 [Scophthalmus maximus]|uniref:Uncharacterized protein n=1 Tax=Scophthalmus maximus TaxID=52904 RepID=A0A6A4SEA8_SCOMX|nr:hypothetical protein F2P81_018329 [Scophthalmus maximus]